MHFSGSAITVKSEYNTYLNFYGNARGGVYSLEGITYTEENSVYTNNSALLGGTISCSKCSISTIAN